ncbi:MAG: class II glutamine amidotransferase [Gemmatimonadota bacterium]|nr:MAG: class II glutamine amidotransferase [Gemmatimonadota bacterium]
MIASITVCGRAPANGPEPEKPSVCRLYTFRSTTPRKVECELICSQNSLFAQSRQDARGESNPDGWGLGTYDRGIPHVVRQAEAAYESDAFRWEAARVETCNVMAHVRRATVGSLRVENTHPFSDGQWMMAHNGHIGGFEAVKPRLLARLSDERRGSIRGSTDSEHIFYLLLTLHDEDPLSPLTSIMRSGVRRIIQWSREETDGSEVALNLVLSTGRETVGLRFGRTLWSVERDLVHSCEVCDGLVHLSESPSGYRAVAVASEPVTSDEDWREIPEETLYRIGPDNLLVTESL